MFKLDECKKQNIVLGIGCFLIGFLLPRYSCILEC